jgi:diguanylate cyclase (GGDEF)-like protein
VSLKAVQRLLAVVVCCFALSAGYISFVIFERQAAIKTVSRYNAAWTVSQALAEFLRLEQVLVYYSVPNSGVEFEEIQLRLDIMFSRLDTFEQGAMPEFRNGRSLRQFIRSDPANEKVLQLLRDRLDFVSSLIKSDGASIDVTRVMQTLRPVDSEMIAFASRASSYGAALAAEDRAELARLHLLFTALAVGLIVCGIALIVLLLRQNRLLQHAYTDIGASAAELENTHGVLTSQNQRFDAALNNMSQALCTCDSDNRLVVFNDGFTRLAGSSRLLQPGSRLDELIVQGAASSALGILYERQKVLIRDHRKGSFTLAVPDGRSFTVAHAPLVDGGWLATYADTSARRQAEHRMWHMAHHDALTDLPNRVFLRDRLQARCGQPHESDEYVTILLLDLDGFKEVNDTLGHELGDQVLKQVAGRLVACAEGEDTVARLGGDEFALLMAGTRSAPDAMTMAERFLATIAEPYVIDGHQVILGASIGVAREPLTSCTPELLLKHADLAMYQAKAEGRSRICRFSPDMEHELIARKAFEADLRDALQKGEMAVFYQPLLSTATRTVESFEALLRWKRGGLSDVSPAEFIPVAEEIGLIDTLGEWVLRTACRDAMGWPSDISVAVNLSPVQFRAGKIVRTAVQALSDTGLPANRLELEITESVLLEATSTTIATLHELKQLGLHIALDDFGTGYSSLSYLSSFPFDKIKIDKSFVRDASSRDEASAVVELIVDLGRKLGIRITAEGVETEAQMSWLEEMGCTQVQGFLFAKPRPVGDIDFAVDVHDTTDFTIT